MTETVQFPKPHRGVSGDGNGDGGIESRLRAVELGLARVETDLKHVATRAWVLAGVVGGMGLAATITIAIIRLFGE